MHINASLWTDTHGRPIQAHGGGLLHLEGVWYWYGEDKSGPTSWHTNATGQPVSRVDLVGISGYRSTDLINWSPMGVVLKAEAGRKNYDLDPGNVLERPKVIYHRATGTFVMWVHIDCPDYKLAAAGVAVADRPEGPFRYLGSTRPQGRDSRDQTVFVDDDGSAYHFASTDMNATTLVTRLSDDYRALSADSFDLFPHQHMEAHAITKAKGRYWYLASGCTGWDPNEARSAVADSLQGPWTLLGNPCRGGPQPELTWGGQSTFLQTLPDGHVLAMFDVWKPRALATSQYLWVMADLNDASDPHAFTLDWKPAWPGSLEAAPLKPAVQVKAATPSRRSRVGVASPNGR
ncbi:MAG: glycoside hydrolase family 43 protein [Planctomycetota bacterium]